MTAATELNSPEPSSEEAPRRPRLIAWTGTSERNKPEDERAYGGKETEEAKDERSHQTQTVRSTFGEHLKEKESARGRGNNRIWSVSLVRSRHLDWSRPHPASSLPPSQPRPPSSKQTAKLIESPSSVQIQRDQPFHVKPPLNENPSRHRRV